MKKLLTILGSVGLIATTGVTVVACGSSTKSVELNTVITITALGDISNNNSATILAAANTMNPDANLDITQLNVTNITKTSATINANDNSKKYTGSVNVTFTATLESLENVITVTQIGIIDTTSTDTDEIKAQAIINGIMAQSQNATNIGNNQMQITVDVATITNTTATISAIDRSEVYTGSVVVTYSFQDSDTIVDLSTLVLIVNLGDLENSDADTILNKLVELNSDANLDVTQLDVSVNASTKVVTNYTATISAKSNSVNYIGSFEVQFTITTLINLEDILSIEEITIDLDNLVNQVVGSEAAALYIILFENGIDAENEFETYMSEVTVTNNLTNNGGTVTVTANNNSTIYTGSVTIRFLIDLDSVVVNETINMDLSVLQTIMNTQDENMVLDLLVGENEYLLASELDVDLRFLEWSETTNSAGFIIITVKSDSLVYANDFAEIKVFLNLDSVIETTEIKVLDISNLLGNVDNVLNLILQNNPNLNISEVEVNIDGLVALIGGVVILSPIENSTLYTGGNVEITISLL